MEDTELEVPLEETMDTHIPKQFSTINLVAIGMLGMMVVITFSTWKLCSVIM